MLQRFADRMTDSEKDERLNHISIIVNRIMAIIDNLLNVNALETGVLAVSLTKVNISETIESLEHEYKDRAALKSISIISRLPSAAVFAQADQTMLFTVLENLLSNALKFSPSHTTVTLGIQAGDDNADDAKNEAVGCRIVVRDEGPGLSDNDKIKLFGKFARLSARPTNGEHSTGLGLSIVKKMVEVMGGRVWCESEAGKGATFIVELPRTEESAS
jgi:signal transduction histidine kinase